ncbi:MAG: hypothetical protein H6822_25765 [Planctomycetaceae bacterium]|nr:hypothetical protein [Planctomycetaceae bacterium]
MSRRDDGAGLIFRGFDCRDVGVCSTCGELFGPCREIGVAGDQCRQLEQLCACENGRRDQPTWERFDFNEVVTLCRCCRGVPLQSGTRWSVWFCESCKRRVLAVNDICESYVIPIGRHSIMASKYRTGAIVKSTLRIPKLRSTLQDISHRTETLITHACQTTLRILQILDGQLPCTPLSEYLDAVRRLPNHQLESFAALCDTMGVPRAVVRKANIESGAQDE